MLASQPPARTLNLDGTAVVGPASQSRVSAPRRPAGTAQPSLRGTLVAAFGAITSLGCAAAIGLASTAGSGTPPPPGRDQPVPIVQQHVPAARP